MTSARPSSGRQRGEIVTLPSGSLRVRVNAGVDPLSGKRLYLTETVPAGPKALVEAKKVRTRLIGQIDEQRNPPHPCHGQPAHGQVPGRCGRGGHHAGSL